MITKGDGVRLITAVLLAGQMMTPDKFFVAESCPRQWASQEFKRFLADVAHSRRNCTVSKYARDPNL